MALTATTISGDLAANGTQVSLTSATGIANKNLLVVDGEVMLVTDVSLSPAVSVVRGYNGKLASAHKALAPAVFGSPTDFVNQPNGPAITSYDATGAITVPTVDTTIYLTGGGVQAMTLAAPAKDQQNTVTIQSLTAHAHTVTNASPGFNSGSTLDDVATFGGAIGDNFTFTAQSGAWNVRTTTNVTLA